MSPRGRTGKRPIPVCPALPPSSPEDFEGNLRLSVDSQPHPTPFLVWVYWPGSLAAHGSLRSNTWLFLFSNFLGKFWGPVDFGKLISKLTSWHLSCQEGPVLVWLPSHVWLFCDPKDSNPLGSSVHGISQTRILKRAAIPFSRVSSLPRDQICSPMSPVLACCFFTTEPPGKLWKSCYTRSCSMQSLVIQAGLSWLSGSSDDCSGRIQRSLLVSSLCRERD